MIIIIQFLISFIQWILGNIFGFYFTEKMHHPEWLDFAKVMYCRKCFTTWFNAFAFICLYLATNHQYHYYLGLGLTLTLLTAIAMHIEEKQHYIDMSEIDKIIEQNKNKDE